MNVRVTTNNGKFTLGQRVRASAAYHKQFSKPNPRRAARIGTVTGFGRTATPWIVWVRWDGNKTTLAYHEQYVEAVE